MLRRRVLKRVGILIGILLGLIILVLLTFPYWLGYALRPAAARFGVSFANYEQAKDGRFILTDLVRTNRAFDLRISRVEGFRPEVWYRRIGQTNQPASFLEVNGWHIVVHEKAASAAGRTNQQRSVYGEWKSAEHYIEQARKWAPKVTLLNGIATYQGRDYTFPIITWEGGKLDASGVWPISPVPFELKGKLTGETSYQLSYAMTPLDLRLVLRFAETNDLLNVKTTAFYKENRADINANFGHEGFLPLTATLKAPDLKVPAELLKLKNYEDLTGSLSGEWKTNNYTLSLKAHAEPFAAMSGKLPPADINVALSGDTNRVHIEKAFSTAPGLQLSISQPVDVSYRGRLLSERAEVRIDADLEKMPWLKMNGSLKGTIILEKGSKFPVATLHAEGANLSVKKFSARSAELEAKLDWPKLEEFNARFQLQTNAVLSLRGSADLKERRLGETLVEAEGAVATNALPAGIHYSSLEISAKVSGPLTNLSHEGSCELRDFETPQTQPLHLDLLWKAEQTTFERLALRARAGPATLLVAGSGYAEEGKTNFVLRELRLSKGDDPYLDLAHGANIAITSNTNAGTLLEIEPIELNGTNKQLVVSGKLSWPALGDVKLNTRNINPELFQFFVKRTLSGIDLPELALAAQWSNGPFYGKLAGNFSVEQPQFKRLSAEVNLDLEENGLTLTRLGVSDPNGPIFDARGFLPLSIRPLDTERVHLSSRDQIDLELHTTRNAALWDTVAKLTKLRVTNAAVYLTVHGTTRRPTGELQIRADSVNYLGLRTNRELPRIGPLEGKIVLNEQILHIPELSVRLAEQ
ncbi:MAG TPA: hypothetical protein VGR78_13250, partial [Verrucomicrobiae bacterium]|nr:hypothetical protein [Verrucomicrobiae bacterium]